MGLIIPWSTQDDDTDYDYYDTPSGNIWRPGADPGQPSGAEPGRPDTGSYEVIHFGGQAAVVVPVADFLRLRALELHASAEDLEDAAAPARSPATKRRPGSDRPGRGASLSFPDRPHVASPPRAWTRTSRQGDRMSTTQPPAGRAPGGGAVASPTQRHPRLALAATTTAGRDLLDKATAVLAAIAHEHIASRLPDADPGKLTQALRAIADTNPPEASQRRGETT
jgi:hypothetical protein